MIHRIIYFYKKENVGYRQYGFLPIGRKRQARQTDTVSFTEKEAGENVKVFFCGIPEYYGVRFGRKSRKNASSGMIRASEQEKSSVTVWNIGQFLRLLQNCCEYVSADAYYLEESFEKELADGEPFFSLSKQRMCGGMIKKLSGQFKGIDCILYAAEEGEEEGQGELPLREQLLRKLHYFFYLGEKTEKYTVLEETLWQEYGMPLIRVRDMQELKECRIRRLLVLDDRQDGGVRYAALPERCVYIDLWSNAEKRAEITENRRDIKYLSEYWYLTQNLDTLGENGYNSLYST